MASLVGGADEAGRGCVVGALVVAGVAATGPGLRRLRQMGVKDSKLLSPKQREALYPGIVNACSTVRWLAIQPSEIDKAVSSRRPLRKLNYLEAVYFAKVIDMLGVSRVTVDACDTVASRFGESIRENMATRCRVTALHKADRDYPAVSAASIVAKVNRDKLIGELKERHGDFGTGYPSDPATRAYFRRWLEEGKEPPDWTRKSWKSWATFRQATLQTR